MGGKHKNSQRTKNNARPSSSGRSAEMLGSSLSYFAGTTCAKDGSFVLPGFSHSGFKNIELNIDPNLQLVLKKMYKKDVTTKLKALQEFNQMVKNTEPDIIKSILEYWSHIYSFLVTDIDHRVREAAHVAHLDIAIKAKKKLAPFLKQLIGPWFISQYDTYPPAASAAINAFQGAFPPTKIQEATVYYQEDILNYIYENIIGQSSKAIQNVKQPSDQESQDKYERIILSNMNAYSYFIKTVPIEYMKKLEEFHTKIISHAKFWDIRKSKSVPLRASFYGVLSAIGQNAPFLYEKNKQQIVTSVFKNLDEGEPIILQNLWESALLISTNLEDWWQCVNVEKIFVPKLFKLLSEAGYGNATIIYPCLLPFISHLPPSIANENFYFKFLDNMQLGLKNKSSITVQTESVAIMKSFFECLDYIVIQHQSNPAFCSTLIRDQIISLLKWCLLDKKACYKIIMNQMAMIIQCWCRSNSENSKMYFKYFWSYTGSLFQDILVNPEVEGDSEKLLEVVARQVHFLKCLNTVVKEKKIVRVNFLTEDKNELTDARKGASIEDSSLLQFGEEYIESLHGTVNKTCGSCIKLINEKKNKNILEHLYTLLEIFDSESFFNNFSAYLYVLFTKKHWMEIYDTVVSEWMKDDLLFCKSVIDIIFLLFKYLMPEEKEYILASIVHLNNKKYLGWSLENTLRYPYNKDPIVLKWLNSDHVSNFISGIVDEEFSRNCFSEFSFLLKLVFSENIDGNFLISPETISQIIDKLHVALTNPCDSELNIDKCARFAAYLLSVLYSENSGQSSREKLLLAVIDLCSNINVDEDRLSKDTRWEINTAWQDAVTYLLPSITEENILILSKSICDIIVGKVFMLLQDFETNQADRISDVVVHFISCAQKSVPIHANNVIIKVLDCSFLTNCKTHLNNLNICAEYIMGNLSSPYVKINVLENVDEKEVLVCIFWAYIKSNVLSSPLEEISEDYEEEAETEKVLDICYNQHEIFVELLHDLTVGLLYTRNYNMTKYSEIIVEICLAVEQKMEVLFASFNDHYKLSIKELLAHKICSDHWLWCKCVEILYSRISVSSLGEVYADIIKLVPHSESKLGFLHLIQTFGKYLEIDCYADFESDQFDILEDIIILRSSATFEQMPDILLKTEKLWARNIDYAPNRNDLKWEVLQYYTELIRLYSSVVKVKKEYLPLQDWETQIVSLIPWTANILRNYKHVKSIEILSLALAVGDLFNTLNQYFIKASKSESSENTSKDSELFYKNIHLHIFSICQTIAEEFQSVKEFSNSTLTFFQEFRKTLSYLSYPCNFSIEDKSLKWLKILNCSTGLLVSPLVSLQLWGYKIIVSLSSKLLQVDSLAVSTNKPHEKGLVLEHLRDVLNETQKIVHIMLSEFKLGEDTCRVQPFTDSFTYTLAYMLLWDIILSLCENASTELRYQYAEWLQKDDFFKNLLTYIFRLIPTEVLQDADGKSKIISNNFVAKPPLDVSDPCTSEQLEHLVCWIYGKSVIQLPALVRQWWINVDARLSHMVNHVTSTYVSPLLCNQELANITQFETKFKNMVVKVHPNVREVVAIYSIDEAHVELIISLPLNYPLGVPDIKCGSHIMGTSHKQWLMQLKMCILHQNGRIWDGLSLWNNNLDKKFDGVEECYICFAVLHPGTYQLPKLSCQTCKKKFHSACLYKWFSTSNKSTCPICRNLF